MAPASRSRANQVNGNSVENAIGERLEPMLRRIAIGCAILLLFAPLGGRTMWVLNANLYEGYNINTDSAGYNVGAVFAGIVAVAVLAFAFRMRPRMVLPLLGAAVAVSVFTLSALASAVTWQDMANFDVLPNGTVVDLDVGPEWAVYPAWGPPFFTMFAVVGAASTLALAIGWLWQRFAASSLLK